MSTATMVALTLLAALLHPFSASSSTVPAFLWSQHRNKNSDKGDIEFVDYRTISPRELAKAVVSQGGWSDMLCSVEKLQQGGDLAVVFVGRELQSSDISSNTHADPALLNLLRESYTKSNFSLAFPYVAASPKKGMENLLVSGFVESCGHDLDITKIALLGSCSMQEYLVSRREETLKGDADLIIFCHGKSGASDEFDTPGSEREIFSELISSLEQQEKKYSVLYVSDPSRSIQYPSIRGLERSLAESSDGNASSNGTCDGVCQVKSSLLEGLLVGIVLLIILICGLCCMAGIQTPTRFEAPQES